VSLINDLENYRLDLNRVSLSLPLGITTMTNVSWEWWEIVTLALKAAIRAVAPRDKSTSSTLSHSPDYHLTEYAQFERSFDVVQL